MFRSVTWALMPTCSANGSLGRSITFKSSLTGGVKIEGKQVTGNGTSRVADIHEPRCIWFETNKIICTRYQGANEVVFKVEGNSIDYLHDGKLNVIWNDKIITDFQHG